MNAPQSLLARIPLWLTAALAAVALLGAAALGSWQSEKQAHAFARDQIRANVTNLAGMVDREFEAQIELVRQLADEPGLRALSLALLDRPDDVTLRGALDTRLQQMPSLEEMDWYTLLDMDFRMIAVSDPAFLGKVAGVQPDVRERVLAGQPVILPPYRTFNRGGNGDYLILQTACVPVFDGEARKGTLCLSTNPERVLLPMLRAAWSGRSGDAYLIDRDGRLRSPSRFLPDGADAAQALEPLMISPLFARVPRSNDDDGALPLPTAADPLTALAAAVLDRRDGAPVLIDHYLDYRAEPVSGGAVWLPGVDLGIVLEIDDEEIEIAARQSQRWLWLLAIAGACGLAVLVRKHGLDRRRIAVSEAQLRGFFENAPASMHLQDAKGRYLKANARYGDLVGVPPQRLVGRLEDELADEIPAEVRASRKTERDEVLATGTALTRPKTVKHADGRTLHVVVVRFPIRIDGSGPIIGVGSVGFDVTAEVEARRALEQVADRLESEVAERTIDLSEARDAAEAAARAKSDFLATMSHEIRTPLNAIMGFTRLAQRVDDPARVAEFLQQVLTSGQHLIHLVDDVLDLSKMDVGGLRLDAEAFAPAALTADVARLMMPRAAEKGLEILLCAEEAPPERVLGDVRRISQILINFLGNAVKFTEAGVVRLRLWHEDRGSDAIELCVDIEDTGIGIPAEALPRLFQPFEQVHTGHRRPHEGSGLGLAISRRLAEAMGGRVFATSTPGRGSTFSLRLPVKRDVGDPAPVPRGTGLRVLVGDAQPEALRRLADGLRLFGFNVVAAESPEDCQRARALQSFDVELLTGPLLAASDPAPSRVRRVLLASGAEGVPPGHAVQARLLKPLWPIEVARALMAVLAITPESAVRPTAPAASASLAGRRILLVEDNPANQQVASGLLALEGIDVTIVGDGAEALHCLSSRAFDAVLMDLHMPVLDGFEATRLLRREPRLRGLPVIGLSASVMSSDHQACFDAGMDAFVAKPIEPDELMACLRRLLIPEEAPPVAPPAPPPSPGGQHPWLVALARHGDFDVPAALRRLMGREPLFIALVERAIRARGEDLGALKAALSTGDAAGMARRLHDFGATAGSLGASALAAECLRAEASLREGRVAPAALGELVARIEETWAYLGTLEAA